MEDEAHLYGFGDPFAKRSKLQEIVEQRRQDVAVAKGVKASEELRREVRQFIEAHGAPQSLAECISEASKGGWQLALAAEFKRASPSKGDINPELDAAQQALQYAQVGASVLSVLTEPTWFKGYLQDLLEVRLKTQAWAEKAQRRRPACLRKDFVIDEYQVDEALAHGGDTVLLMAPRLFETYSLKDLDMQVSILPKSRLKALVDYCPPASLRLI